MTTIMQPALFLGHLPKQPRRRSRKPFPTLSAARRRFVLEAYTERVNAGLVTVAGYLERLGADADLIRRYASQLGKRAKQVFLAEYGAEPVQAGLALVGRRRIVEVYAYTAEQLPVLEKAARNYQRTADLFAGAR